MMAPEKKLRGKCLCNIITSHFFFPCYKKNLNRQGIQELKQKEEKFNFYLFFVQQIFQNNKIQELNNIKLYLYLQFLEKVSFKEISVEKISYYIRKRLRFNLKDQFYGVL